VLTLTAAAGLTAADEAGGTAGAYLRMAPDARSAALGNSMAAVVGDVNIGGGNPAVLPYLKERQFSSSFQFLTLGRSHNSLVFGLPLPPSAGMSISWIHAGVDDIIGRNLSNEPTYEYRFSQNAMNVSFSLAPMPWLSLGFTGKILSENVSASSSTGFSTDFGILLTPFKNFSLGFVMKDLSGKVTWDISAESFVDMQTQQSDYFPAVFQAEFAYLISERYLLTGSYSYSNEIEPEWHFGGEAGIGEHFFLRAGLDNGSPVFGAGTSYPALKNVSTRIDYAFVLPRAGEGNSHLFTWTFFLND